MDANGAAVGSTLNFGASFTDVPGGTAHWVFSGGTNYFDQSGDVAIVISAKHITGSFTTHDKMYDGSTAAAVGSCSLSGVIGMDNVLLVGTAAFASASVGTWTVAMPGATFGGTAADNYALDAVTTQTASISPFGIDDNGNLVVTGNDSLCDSTGDTIVIDATNPGAVKVAVNGSLIGTYAVAPGKHIIAYGLGGSDVITETGGVNLEAHGGCGNDIITGGAGHDVIFGDEGNDILTGSAGNDVIVGGGGNDRLVGSAGADLLIAGALTPGFGGTYAQLRMIDDLWAIGHADGDLADSDSDGDVFDTGTDQLTGSSGARLVYHLLGRQDHRSCQRPQGRRQIDNYLVPQNSKKSHCGQPI